MSLTIQVENESIAADYGLKSGDKIRKINGQEIRDQIDFSFHSSEEYLDIEFEKPDGTISYSSVQRIYNQTLGISVIPPEITQCDNACVFCFIHQQPKGMRKSLYVMDDDYRYSFSDGNFITLTNLKPQEWKRIYQLKLSPLYISVHATEPAVRQKMVKHPRAGLIMQNLRKLMKKGISFHAQIVLCHGYNDKEHLDRTIQDLVKLRPYMNGMAIVPAGLTHFRKNLPYLKQWDDEMAMETIKQVEKWQKYFRQKFGETVVYLGDEFYYLANKKIPPASHYDGFYYVEDGIGTTGFFYHIFNKHKKHLPLSIAKPKRATVICGVIAEKYLRDAVSRMNEIENLKINLVAIKNNYFGKGITVTGLITATDLIYQLKDLDIGDELIIPAVVLRKEDKLFLDNYTVSEVEAALKTKIRVCEMGAANFIDACLA
jgi:putative radical SAM enzyme (TIGR03279 family)